MPVKQILDGVKCVQFELAVGNKQRRCVYCGHIVKKPRWKAHECKGKIFQVMSNYVRLCSDGADEYTKNNKCKEVIWD